MKKSLFCLTALICITVFFSCGQNSGSTTSTSVVGLATITTSPVTGNLTYTVDIAGTSATIAGAITDQGGSPVIERGLCWNTSGSPTVLTDSYVTGGSGTGTFTVSLTGLTTDTTYHVRAYAVNYNGTAYSNEITFNSGKTFGTDYAGGYVFYNNGNGGGLVSSKVNQAANVKWSNVTGTAVGTTGSAIGTGLANTNAIVAQSGHTSSAAQHCLDYSDGTYDDWYLPSQDEAKLMYTHIGSYLLSDSPSWSSTETSATTAYVKNLGEGFSGSWVKSLYGVGIYVRAIRSF